MFNSVASLARARWAEEIARDRRKPPKTEICAAPLEVGIVVLVFASLCVDVFSYLTYVFVHECFKSHAFSVFTVSPHWNISFEYFLLMFSISFHVVSCFRKKRARETWNSEVNIPHRHNADQKIFITRSTCDDPPPSSGQGKIL